MRYVEIYLGKDIIEAIDEQKQQINPAWSREDYIEHLVAMHKKVLEIKEQNDAKN